MKISPSIFVWVFPVLFFVVGNSRLEAQVGPAGKTITITGKITALKGQDLSLAAPSGEVRVKLPDKTTVRQEIAIKLSDIEPGMYVGATADKQADGTLYAAEVNVFSEDQRGIGEGHRPWPSGPNATMTNANVEKVEDVTVQDVKGRIMSLKYKGGEVKVFVPPNIRMVKRVVSSREALKPGVEVSVRANQGADGSMTASQITIRAGR
jgi:hypothetical protein